MSHKTYFVGLECLTTSLRKNVFYNGAVQKKRILTRRIGHHSCGCSRLRSLSTYLRIWLLRLLYGRIIKGRVKVIRYFVLTAILYAHRIASRSRCQHASLAHAMQFEYLPYRCEKAVTTERDEAMQKTYTLIGPDGVPYQSGAKGSLGGNRRAKIYGRLDCATAIRHVKAGTYQPYRVFFASEQDAVSAGYRPCGNCMREAFKAWKAGGGG